MKKIRIITNSNPATNLEELNASPNVKDLIKKAKSAVTSTEVDVKILQDSFSETYENLMEVISETIKKNEIKPSEVKFTLAIESGGEISFKK